MCVGVSVTCVCVCGCSLSRHHAEAKRLGLRTSPQVAPNAVASTPPWQQQMCRVIPSKLMTGSLSTHSHCASDPRPAWRCRARVYSMRNHIRMLVLCPNVEKKTQNGYRLLITVTTDRTTHAISFAREAMATKYQHPRLGRHRQYHYHCHRRLGESSASPQ